MSVDERSFRVDGRTAVVTGAGSGIGRAVAQVLARAGAAVVVADIDAASGEATAAGILAEGGRASFVRTDVSRRADLEAAVERAVAEFGGLDIMCNIAGVPSPVRPMVDASEAELDRELGLTLKAVLFGCQAAAPHLAGSGRGAIVNISSTAVDIVAPGYGLYHLGKVAVAGLTRVLAQELGPQGVRVNAIAPGATLTNFSVRNFTGPDGRIDPARRDAWIAGVAARSPLNRVGEPEDQALLVLYLVSDAARFVTGQVMRANGGWSMP